MTAALTDPAVLATLAGALSPMLVDASPKQRKRSFSQRSGRDQYEEEGEDEDGEDGEDEDGDSAPRKRRKRQSTDIPKGIFSMARKTATEFMDNATVRGPFFVMNCGSFLAQSLATIGRPVGFDMAATTVSFEVICEMFARNLLTCTLHA